jgi:hypothetical protein
MRTKLLLLFLLLFAGGMLNAQRNCGTMDYLESQLQSDPKRADKLQKIEEHTQKVLGSSEKAVNGIVSIPVVVHVLYNSSAENISDAQILSQIQVLNEDFRRTNADADNVWSQATDSEIEFCMATTDPNGNATNGITRTSTSTSAFGTNDQMKFNSSGGKDAWSASSYLNVWVCDISGGILGYAQFPGGSASTDGVVIDYQYFGTIGTASAPFDLGRTATHEVGHWLNLRHIWGDGSCGVDDFVSDTPTSDGANYGCATGHVSCSTTDMVQNYMDYSDDACMNLMTVGQKNRMRALFESGGYRASLLASTACGTPVVPTCSDGIQNGDETGVDCGGSSCAPCSCNGTEVTVSITFDNYPEETSWSITNSGGSVVASGGTYGSQPDGSTVSGIYCLADGCYDFSINDAYGDGICCSYGNGSYSVNGGGNTLASGGSFGSNETTNFCVGSGGPAPTCNDGVQNGDETGIDCGGSCAPCATCNDGVQNGNETGVDCGGSCGACPTCNDGVQNGDETGVDCGGSCAPCNTGECSTVTVNSTSFDSWGLWNDGGSDCRRSSNDASYAYSGNYCVRLRDNSSSSTTTTDNLNLSNFEEITVDFIFYARSMENGEDFWLQISNNGGSSYSTVASYTSGSSFNNNTFYGDAVTIQGPFASNTRIRFRCDASTNSDYIYLDDVVITGCANGARLDADPAMDNEAEVELKVDLFDALNVFPNPASAEVNLTFNLHEDAAFTLMVTDIQGRVVMNQQMQREAGQQLVKIPTSSLESGTYLLHLVSPDGKSSKRFVIFR